ncbi:engulfment and cell motility ELM family protein [Tieghemostelium lacteum]|uniref:Engulfment and cell motility ELM family protein n=1 Tax=Tieghemostelium lacteum TaxID=361077 RepID=A0A152A7P8_TIELA|nr:engulfment and cell motility ELM family protein [Tieghemostelium lacteum]|eukprot:KYR02260.1 engulfment and cell motility ELM family protein [Tieghemostelium lacteum]
MKLNIHYQDKIQKDHQFDIENELNSSGGAVGSVSASGSSGITKVSQLIDKCCSLFSLTSQLPNQYQLYLLNGNVQLENLNQIDATCHDLVLKSNPNINIDPVLSNLNDPNLKKKALFDLKDLMKEENIVKKFVEKNGIQCICDQLQGLSGNTLSYALNAIQSIMQFEFSSSSIPIDLIKYLIALLDTSTNPSITKTTLSILYLFNHHRPKGYIELNDVIQAYQQQQQQQQQQTSTETKKPTINHSLVVLLGSSTVDVQLNSLTLINSMLSKSQQLLGVQDFTKLIGEFDTLEINLKLKKLVESAVITQEFRKQLYLYQRHKLMLIKHRKAVVFNKDSPEHDSILMRLWTACYPQVKLENRVSEQWKLIGFQGTDPSTDFRGTGIFGLENLVYFAENHTEKFKKIIQNQIDRKDREYPTCTAGINITQMLTNEIFKVADEKVVDMTIFPILFSHPFAFEEVYSITFQILDTTWDEMMGSYMNWQKIFSSVKNQILTTLESKPSTLEAFHWAAYLKNSNTNGAALANQHLLDDDHDPNDDIKKLKQFVKKDILEMIRVQKIQLLMDGYYFRLQKPMKSKNSLYTSFYIKLLPVSASSAFGNSSNSGASSIGSILLPQGSSNILGSSGGIGASLNANPQSSSSNTNPLSSSLDLSFLTQPSQQQELQYTLLQDNEKPTPNNLTNTIRASEITNSLDSTKKKDNKNITHGFTLTIPKDKEEKQQLDLTSTNKEDISNFVDGLKFLAGKSNDLSVETIEEYKTLVSLSMKLKLLDLEGVDLPKESPLVPDLPPSIN